MNIAARILSALSLLTMISSFVPAKEDLAAAENVEHRREEYFRCYGIPCVPVELAGQPRLAGVYWQSFSSYIAIENNQDPFPDIPSFSVGTGEDSSFVYPKFQFSVFGGPMQEERVATIQLERLSPDSTLCIDAVVSPHQLRFLRLQMNGCAEPFRLATSSSPPENASCVPLKPADLMVKVPLKFDVWGIRDFQLNLMLPRVLHLTTETAEQLQRMGQAKPLRRNKPDGDTKLTGHTTEYIVRKFQLGSIVFENVSAEDSAAVNTIGLGALRQLNMELDFPEQKAYFWRNDEDNAAIQIRPLTRVFFPEFVASDHLRVRKIVDESDYGDHLQPGDRILQFQGKPVSEISFWSILDSLRQFEGTLPMKIERKGEVRLIELPMTPDFTYPPTWPDPVLNFDFDK